MKIFYNSSMPRSGSTILQNIMGQNPEFYVSPTSGLLELIFAARANYTDSPEFKAQDLEIMKKAFLSFCKEGMKGYYKSITDKPYIVDKSRGWGIYHSFLSSVIEEEPKIICIVRDLREIICSMEKNFRKSQDKNNPIVNNSKMTGTNTAKRIDIWVNSQPVGLALERLKQIILEGIDKKMLFIRFEDLTRSPNEEMKRVYEYLGLPFYNHDFDNVAQITVEDDKVYGVFGDHVIRQKISPVPVMHNQILGKQNSDWIFNNYKWYFDYFKYKI